MLPMVFFVLFFFFSSRRRHTRCYRDWSSDVCSSDLLDTGIAKLCAQVKQGLRLLVLCTPAATGKGFSLARSPFDMPIAVNNRIHKRTAYLWPGTGREIGRAHV